jgi:hypothetical protein
MNLAAFHIHTSPHSRDANLNFDKLLKKLLKHNISLVAVTNHNNLQGAFEFQEYVKQSQKDIFVIPGSEIATNQGEIIGLFLSREIPWGLSLAQTIQEIKKQDGLTYLPHPFDSVRRERVKDKQLILDNIDQIDIIEVFNSRNMKEKDNQAAVNLATQYHKKILWGSDAHFAYDLDKCLVQIPHLVKTKSDFLNALPLFKPFCLKKTYRGFLHSCFKKYCSMSIFKG